MQILGASLRASLLFSLAMPAICTAAYMQTSAEQSAVAQAEEAPRTLPVSPHACSPEDIEYKPGSFTSGGKAIRVDQFQPKLPGRYPVIIMVHGSGGLLTHTGTAMPSKENFGEMQIACAGYVSLLVHYFDRTGILSTGDLKLMEQQSPDWLATLSKAVDYVSSLPKVDSRHIGLLGESLGGYLALSLAMTDARIKAVSEYGGGMRLREGDNPRNLPPVLIQHGGNDSIVPVSEARRLAQLLADSGVPFNIHIYEGLEHYLNTKARAEALAHSIQFFNQYLKQT
jgi:carboxymethylenebutenolidase